MPRPRVLIAEDEGILAEELRERLLRMGLLVVAVAASGEEAIVGAAETAPDVVLMDIRLKGHTDGIDAAAAIRDRFHVPVVFVTAHSDAATIERAKHVEPSGYLIKPFTEQDLNVTIQMALHRGARDQVARRLLEAQKLESLGRVVGGVTHLLSNLLVPIVGNASMAALEVDAESAVGCYLDRINVAAERAADLCRQMRAYGGNGRLEIRRLNINTLIEGVQDLLRAAVAERVRLTLDLAADLPQVDGDPGQVHQLLLNLVLNGFEAIKTDGTIAIRTRKAEIDSDTTIGPERLAPGAYAVIEVADNGTGMDEDTRSRVFEPFFTTKFLGRGLGLAAVQGIARGHRGAIRVESTPGAGSAFRVYLPAAATAATACPAL